MCLYGLVAEVFPKKKNKLTNDDWKKLRTQFCEPLDIQRIKTYDKEAREIHTIKKNMVR